MFFYQQSKAPRKKIGNSDLSSLVERKKKGEKTRLVKKRRRRSLERKEKSYDLKIFLKKKKS
jgi:hypothetical protein